MISGNMVGSYSQIGKTFILTDEDGNELTGVVVGQETVFDATDNDVREGKVYASDEGVSTGTKNIPSYHTTEGWKLIPNGSEFSIPFTDNRHEYTKFQAIICAWNTSLSDSVAAEKVAIENSVYSVLSTTAESAITVTNGPNSINLGITNSSGSPYLLRYFTYKEVY